MKINLKGVTKEAIIGVLILILALVNAILTMFGYKVLPISNDDIYNIVSATFIVVTALYNTWKNRNISSASQIAQQITDAIKDGEVLEEDIKNVVDKFKNQSE